MQTFPNQMLMFALAWQMYDITSSAWVDLVKLIDTRLL